MKMPNLKPQDVITCCLITAITHFRVSVISEYEAMAECWLTRESRRSSQKVLVQCHLLHQKSHVTSPRSEGGAVPWEARAWPSQLWHGGILWRGRKYRVSNRETCVVQLVTSPAILNADETQMFKRAQITNSMEKIPSWEADQQVPPQTPPPSMKPDYSFPSSQDPAISLCTQPHESNPYSFMPILILFLNQYPAFPIYPFP
jgi:hypothetical protein